MNSFLHRLHFSSSLFLVDIKEKIWNRTRYIHYKNLSSLLRHQGYFSVKHLLFVSKVKKCNMCMFKVFAAFIVNPGARALKYDSVLGDLVDSKAVLALYDSCY